MKKTILTKLNKEAEDYANEMYRDQVRSQIPGQVWEEGHIAWLDLVYEKFAELIVQECARVFYFGKKEIIHPIAY
jgi:hypothetical protein